MMQIKVYIIGVRCRGGVAGQGGMFTSLLTSLS